MRTNEEERVRVEWLLQAEVHVGRRGVGEKPFEGFAPTGLAANPLSPLITTYSPRPHTTDGCFSAANPPGITE